VPQLTHIDPWMCPVGAQVELCREGCVQKVLKLSSEVSECKPLACGECGHGWEAIINIRTRVNNPSGCPKCSTRGRPATSNLQEWCAENGRADLLEEWAHPDKAPQDFSRASGSKVPWTCGECAHGWQARIASRTLIAKPSGCPKCNPPGGPATSNLQEWCAENGRADLLKEWAHPDKAPQAGAYTRSLFSST
jgi:hypothetical protein